MAKNVDASVLAGAGAGPSGFISLTQERDARAYMNLATRAFDNPCAPCYRHQFAQQCVSDSSTR